MSFLRAPKGEWDCGQVFSSALTVESNTEEREHTPGAKPRVDSCLVAHVNGEVLYKVPVDVKKRQLAHYMG